MAAAAAHQVRRDVAIHEESADGCLSGKDAGTMFICGTELSSQRDIQTLESREEDVFI